MTSVLPEFLAPTGRKVMVTEETMPISLRSGVMMVEVVKKVKDPRPDRGRRWQGLYRHYKSRLVGPPVVSVFTNLLPLELSSIATTAQVISRKISSNLLT